MPIAVRVVNDADFTAWLAEAKKKYRERRRRRPTAVAAAGETRATVSRQEHREQATRDNVEGTDHGNDGSTAPTTITTRTTTHGTSDRLAPLRLFDQPQGHRHDVPDVRHRRAA